MEAALDLMRRMPPIQSETALSSLLALLPHHSSELLSLVDQPLQVLSNVDSGKKFLLCDYNRDGDSYRSPWSSKYHPPLEDGGQPSEDSWKLEIEANDIFAIYREHKCGLTTEGIKLKYQINAKFSDWIGESMPVVLFDETSRKLLSMSATEFQQKLDQETTSTTLLANIGRAWLGPFSLK